MPKRKRSAFSRRTAQRSVKRRRLTYRRRLPLARVPRALNSSTRSGPFPRSATVSLRYVDNLGSIDPGVGVASVYSYRANSIFDPNYTGVGHQPYGHDTLATVYSRYKVNSSTITCHFFQDGNLGSALGICSITLSSDAAAPTNPTLVCETPETSYKPIGTADGGRGITKLVKTYKARRFFGRKRNSDLTANFGVDPAEVAYFHIQAQGITATADLSEVYLYVTITYNCTITEPLALGQS